jgi:SAM-dependent methyltransferase
MFTAPPKDQPSFGEPTSQFVTSSQFDEARFHEMLEWFGWGFGRNRKLWEYLYILNVLDRHGLDGARLLGFGCGRELIPGLITTRGAYVVATDFAEEADRNDFAWASRGLDELFPDHLVARGARRDMAEFRHVDMNDIPTELRDFDALWSCGSLEHIGGLGRGIDFILNAMDCLKPGGVAVHTTEFNVSPGAGTYESPSLSLYRDVHIHDAIDRLIRAGHRVHMNWTRGETPEDKHVDRYQSYDLSIVADVCGYEATSVGLIIQKV